jgi:hypothetical protein
MANSRFNRVVEELAPLMPADDREMLQRALASVAAAPAQVPLPDDPVDYAYLTLLRQIELSELPSPDDPNWESKIRDEAEAAYRQQGIGPQTPPEEVAEIESWIPPALDRYLAAIRVLSPEHRSARPSPDEAEQYWLFDQMNAKFDLFRFRPEMKEALRPTVRQPDEVLKAIHQMATNGCRTSAMVSPSIYDAVRTICFAACRTQLTHLEQLKAWCFDALIQRLDFERIPELADDVLQRDIQRAVEHLFDTMGVPCHYDVEGNAIRRPEYEAAMDEVVSRFLILFREHGPPECADPCVDGTRFWGQMHTRCCQRRTRWLTQWSIITTGKSDVPSSD